jgi:hypothetical protein
MSEYDAKISEFKVLNENLKAEEESLSFETKDY